MTPEDILMALYKNPPDIMNSEEMKKFIQGFAYQPPTKDSILTCKQMIKKIKQKKQRGLMIRDYCEWREKQEPFVDDKEFFIQNYKVNPDPILQDLFKEIYLIRKELDEQCDDE